MVQGLSQLKQPTQLCQDFCVSKQPRNAFKSQAPHRSKDKLEVLYSNVCGPFETLSLGGNAYFVSFVDEFTRMLWIYLIKKKNEVLSIFQKFKVCVKNNVVN